VADLNPAQRDAVATLSGPLLVLAGAGTGKTRVITYRIAQLVRSGIVPHRILAVTFTNKAAREMRERALHLLGRRPKGVKPPEISTFHALCVRILRRHAERLGYPKEFSIYDRGDQESVVRHALRAIRVSSSNMRPGELLAQIGNWKNQGVSPETAQATAEGDRNELSAVAFGHYQAQLRAAGAMDFDDLLLQTNRLFAEHPEARFAEASRFDHLLIDEYQDTNRLQYEIVKALAERHRNLCVVGDDDQSIYGWRGAEVAHILSFHSQWPDAHVVRLESNYRSRAPILELANALILHNSARHQKVLRPSREGGAAPRMLRMENETIEAEHVVREIKQLLVGDADRRVTPSEIAILFRTNEQPRAFELELRREKIPYVLVGGLSFYDRREVKDVLSYLRVLANPLDEVSLLRVINTPARGIGTSSIQAVLDYAVSQGRPLWSVLPEISAIDLPAAVYERIEGFQKLIEGFRAKLGQGSIAELVREILTAVDYKAEIDRNYTGAGEAESRWLAVEELVNSAALYEQRDENPSLIGFLEEATLSDRDDKDDDPKRERHAITLMTLHSAKGLEFPHVYMVGVEEGILPHQRSVLEGNSPDEERRLCYVGVTRAQETLTLTFAKTRMKWGKPRPCIPSRFLMEMKGDTERAKRAAEAAKAMFGAGLAKGDTADGAAEDAAGAPKKKSRGKAAAKEPAKKRAATRR
jgi:DNA helicase-2/ATP-dependent DNA helicase PcrA